MSRPREADPSANYSDAHKRLVYPRKIFMSFNNNCERNTWLICAGFIVSEYIQCLGRKKLEVRINPLTKQRWKLGIHAELDKWIIYI